MLGGNRGKIRVALYVGELKFFHPDFKDYFYLPEEDTAIHKSVSSYVDKDHREQAKASNCYTKKSGEFLPEWEEIVRPVFRENYKDSTMYFELTEDIKRSPEIFTKYAEHLINMIIYAKQD